jgi:CHASE2 domain-containing sensor protein
VATESYSNGRHFLFDRYQRKMPRAVQSQPVTIVAIDEKSLAHLGQWPWPRHRLAALVDAINQHNPAAIGLDIYMPEADQTSPAQVAHALQRKRPQLAEQLRALPSNDQLLATTLAHTPTVLGAAGFDFKTYTTSTGMRTWPLQLQGAERLPASAREYPAVLASLAQLQNVAAGQALLNVDADDGTVRRMPLVASIGGHPVPSLASEMYRVALGVPGIQVRTSRHGIESVSVADLQVPTQPNGDVLVHFAPKADTLQRYVSALDVLQGNVNPEAMNGKLVLVGLTGMGLSDMKRTALGEHVPGLEIQAQIIEAIFENQLLQRPWWMLFAEIACALIVGGLMIWLLPRVQPTHRLGAIYRMPMAGVIGSFGINAVAVGAGFYLFYAHGLLFDAASFFLVTSLVFGMIFTFVQASAAKAKEDHWNRQWEELQQRAERAEAALQARTTTHGTRP